MRELLFLLLVLACPLAMFFMVRGGHGHGGHSHATSPGGSHDERLSAEKLRRRRRELDRLIEEREQAEAVGSEGIPLRAAAAGRGLPARQAADER